MKIIAAALLAATPLFSQIAQDEHLFLEPLVERALKEVTGQLVIDTGASLGKWNAQAKESICDLKGDDLHGAHPIAFFEGETSELSYKSETFERIFGMNLLSSLPDELSSPKRGLEEQCGELARVLKKGGKMLLVAPASFDRVFTDGSLEEELVLQKIARILGKIGADENSDCIQRHLEELKEVNRATFVRRNDRLILVTDQKELQLGEEIWRKEPDGVKLSLFQNEEAYLRAFASAGLVCDEIFRPCFFGKVKHRLFHAKLSREERGLGESYIEHNPFTVYSVVKPA